MTNRYIADCHFGHGNILKFDHRPFENIEEMESVMVSNWNSVVKNDDTTYILGDFCWNKESEWIRILDSLNGNKVLIRGNHDIKEMSATLKRKFIDIKDYKEITDNQRHVIMSHYPIMFYKGAYDPNCYMLCGHIHLTRENDFLLNWKKIIQDSRSERGDSYGQIYNVGCMVPYINYIPRTLEEIVGK